MRTPDSKPLGGRGERPVPLRKRFRLGSGELGLSCDRRGDLGGAPGIFVAAKGDSGAPACEEILQRDPERSHQTILGGVSLR